MAWLGPEGTEGSVITGHFGKASVAHRAAVGVASSSGRLGASGVGGSPGPPSVWSQVWAGQVRG